MQTVRKTVKKFLDSVPGMLFFLACLFFFNMPEEFALTEKIMKLGNQTIYYFGGAVFILYAIVKKEPWKDGLFLTSLVFNVFVLFTTALNKGETMTILNNYVVCGTGIVLTFSLFYDVNVKKFAWVAFIYYFLLVILNNSTAIVYMSSPGGYTTWFSHQHHGAYDVAILCGNYNLTFIYVAIAYALGVFVSEKYCRWIWPLNLLMLGFSVVVAVRTQCETSLIVYLLIGMSTFVALLAKRFKAFEWIPKALNSYVIAALNIFAAVVLYMASVGKFKLPEGIDVSMHGRRLIWQFALESFFRKPLFGHGLRVPIEPTLTVPHVHSIFLELPHLSGIFGTLIFLALVLVIIMMIRKAEDKGIRYCFQFVFGLFFTASLVEYYPAQGMFTLFAAVYYGAHAVSKNVKEERPLQKKSAKNPDAHRDRTPAAPDETEERLIALTKEQK